MDPVYGPCIWTLYMDPVYGPCIWTLYNKKVIQNTTTTNSGEYILIQKIEKKREEREDKLY